MTKKLSNKKIETIVNGLYNKHCTGVQFNVLDLTNVLSPARQVLKDGGSIESAEACLIIDRDNLRLN